jgi:transcriptional regulator with XRE-family HTH domain
MDTQGDVREFLASRRARITPERAGLPNFGGTRRVAGLRRAEVAMLAGVSPDYYTRLERGNLSGVSDSVLDAIARALQLDDAERSHLHDLARTANTSPRSRQRRPARQQVRPGVRSLLDAMTDAPAFVRNGRLDILAVNPLGQALYAPAFASPARPVNLARFCFLDPAAEAFHPGWAEAADTTVNLLRPRPAATRTTRNSPIWSVSSPPEARSSAPGGPRTTCACTTPASNTSSTLSSAGSTSRSRPCRFRPTPV